MPKKPRKPEEITAFKDEILENAIALMSQEGYNGFSMRKLASRIGFSAKTIYNYFKNQDELYLEILTRGFTLLHDQCHAAYTSMKQPIERIHAMARAYIDFGLGQPNFYNLMFTWHVPKYNDFIGTSMEPVARIELETALRVSDLFIRAIRECATYNLEIAAETARFIMITFWTQLHGYIAGYNNTLLNYMHEEPLSLKEKMIETVRTNFERELGDLLKKNTR